MYNINIEEAKIATEFVKQRFNQVLSVLPTTAIILGSGLGEFTNTVKVIASLNYADIPFLGTTAVAGHKGVLSIVEVAPSKTAFVMEGRFHYYEGYSPKQVAFPVVLLSLLGVKNLIVTNASGGINPSFVPGDLMIITDHINLTGNHPLIGKNNPELGQRFLDLTMPYCDQLIAKAKLCAAELNLSPKEGVYLGVSGPSYETSAEIRAFGILGADAVGMSTVYEVIMANYLRIRVLGIATITNMATGIAKTPHTHEGVVNVANQISQNLSTWVRRVIAII
jgi:purine-nucleoside phosphorylase